MQVIREPFSVTGNQCEKGAQFALQELENPKRVVTSVVKAGADIVAVRTDRAVDKSQISNVMKAIKRIKVSLPVMPGQIVARNIADTGADLVATWYVN